MKLQISPIFEGSYKFLFANVLAIIGIVWLPYAVAILVSGLAVAGAVPPQWWQGDFSQITQITKDAALPMIAKFIGLSVVVMFVWIVTSSMVTVAIQRRALGLSRGAVFAYFSLGAPVWRLIGAYLLLFLFMIGISIGVTLACGLAIAGASAVLSKDMATLIGVVLGITGWCGFFYVIFRWSFFIAPVVVAEGRIGLGRAWQLGRGNFWRIFAILLIVSLPISVAGGILSQVFLPMFGGMGDFSHMPEHPTDAEVWAAMHQLLTAVLPALGISALIQTIALSGVTNGAQALAYRQLTDAQSQMN